MHASEAFEEIVEFDIDEMDFELAAKDQKILRHWGGGGAWINFQ
jgi:hypothetical protein